MYSRGSPPIHYQNQLQQQQFNQTMPHHQQQQQQQIGQRMRNLSDTDSSYIPGKFNFSLNFLVQIERE